MDAPCRPCVTSPPRAHRRTPADEYLDWITGLVRVYGFPDWYIERLALFAKSRRDVGEITHAWCV